jgi:hypothetical protein
MTEAIARYYDESVTPDIIAGAPPPVLPTITALTPATMVVNTPTTITVTGTNYDAGSVIYQGSPPVAQITTYISATSLSFSAEADQVGHFSVEVRNGNRRSNSMDCAVTAVAGAAASGTRKKNGNGTASAASTDTTPSADAGGPDTTPPAA